MFAIKCYTLFDINDTGVFNRKPPNDLDTVQVAEWQKNRNRQVNLDTILQVISLRSQPENISKIQSSAVNFKSFGNFGFLFDDEDDQLCFNFEFSVSHKSVFDDGINNLGSLYQDCEGVPMLKIGTEWDKLPNFLDTSPELRNIYFEVISNE